MTAQKNTKPISDKTQLSAFTEIHMFSGEDLDNHPVFPEVFIKAGLFWLEKKEYEQAIICFEHILLDDPDNFKTIFYLANALYGLGKLNEAEVTYRKAAEKNRGDSQIYNNWGIVLREKGNLEKAVTCLQKAVQLDSNNARAYYNLGNVLSDLGKEEGALRCYQKALELDPGDAVFYKTLGNALLVQKKLEEGRSIYNRALSLFPEDPEIFFGLGAVLKEQGHLDEAVDCYQKAIEVNPNLARAYYNLGNVYLQQGQLEKAKAQLEEALRLDPFFAEAYNNLGTTLKEANQIENALKMFDKAVEIRPDFPEARWNLGLTHLVTGNFQKGWEGYEWRWEKPDYKKFKRSFSQPLWNGEDLAGKTILLHAEQGFGDALQFIRFAPLVAESKALVLVECPRKLKNLFSGMDGVARVIERGESLPDFDRHCPLMTLPRIFGTNLDTIPRKVPYLKVNPDLVQSWKDRIPIETGKIKVGLVWSGNPEHLNDRNRSCPLEILEKLLEIGDACFFSLQIEPKKKDNPLFKKLIDLTSHIRDFADTAALIENLDLVISVDTAVAHLTGAFGKKIWTFLSFSPDWRWMLDREDSPWYPSMRLYRQSKTGDWLQVVARVSMDLRELKIEKSPEG